MDLDKILHFVPTHIEQIIAVLGALFLVTTILLLIRSLKEKPDESSGGIGVDVRTIEGALKRVLSQNPPTVVQQAGEGSTVIADLAPLKNALAEKEKQLAQLNLELDEARAAAAAAAAAPTGSAPAADTAGNSQAVSALELEISDLKARLAEYEIIEDDIADLALYKEENARLKKEIEEARTTGTPAGAAPIVEANPALGIPGLTEALEAEAEAPPAPASATSTLESLDTEKMLAEAEDLANSEPGEEREINALSDLLDTDKLLEEVNSLDAQDVMSEFKDKSKLG